MLAPQYAEPLTWAVNMQDSASVQVTLLFIKKDESQLKGPWHITFD
jgi:hypothetical protein